jgi:hypothetical protein
LITPINSASFKRSHNEISSYVEAEYRFITIQVPEFFTSPISTISSYFRSYLPYSLQPSESTTTSTTIRTTTSTTTSVVKRIYTQQTSTSYSTTTSTTISTTTSTASVDSRKKELNCTTEYSDILDYPVPRFSDGEWISGKVN